MSLISTPRPKPPKPKIAVKMVLACNEKGIMTPLFLFWKDGSKFKIDEVIDIKPRGVNSILYKVKIQVKIKELYFDRNKWYVNPYDTILENTDKHLDASSIDIKPLDTPIAYETYNYTYKYNGDAAADKIMDYKEKKVPLYNSSAAFTLTVNDTYSGIREISWSVIGQDNQDSKNNQSGTVKVNNLGILSGDSDGWSKTSIDENLVTSMTKNITVKNNSNDIVILLELTDRAGNKSYDYYVLGIDSSKPNINVTVSGTASNGKYFSTDRTITVVVKERNFDSSKFDLVMSKNNADISINSSQLSWKHSETDSKATDSTTHTATYTIKKTQEGDYKLSVKAQDKAGNKNSKAEYNGSAPTDFIIDSTRPKVNVSMTGASANEKYYFNTDRIVTIVVTDRNFDPKDVKLVINGSTNSRKLKWTQNQSGSSRTNATTNTATFTISAEADYTFSFTCNDLAEMPAQRTVYATDDCERFTIDKTAPTITVSQMIYQSANNGKNKNGEKASIPITVTVNDKNIGNMYKNNAVTSKEVTETLNVAKLTSSEAESTFNLKSSGRNSVVYSSSDLKEDGIYTLNLSVQDCAGNHARVVTYPSSETGTAKHTIDKTTNFFTFSVNRNGSAFSTDSSTMDLIGKYYVQRVENDIVIYETNVDDLVGDNLKSNVKIKKDGVTVDASSFITVKKTSNSSSWKQYSYIIDKEFFDPEAEYTISMESKDKADNNAYSSLKMAENTKLTFVVHRTLPVVTITGVTDDKSYSKDSQHVKVRISDDVLLMKIQILVNGEIAEELEAKDFGEYFISGEFIWEYDFKESSEPQKIEVKCWDAASNNNISEETGYGSIVQNFMISTNTKDIIRFWIVNHILIFVIILVMAVSIIALLILFFVLRRRKENDVEQ